MDRGAWIDSQRLLQAGRAYGEDKDASEEERLRALLFAFLMALKPTFARYTLQESPVQAGRFSILEKGYPLYEDTETRDSAEVLVRLLNLGLDDTYEDVEPWLRALFPDQFPDQSGAAGQT